MFDLLFIIYVLSSFVIVFIFYKFKNLQSLQPIKPFIWLMLPSVLVDTTYYFVNFYFNVNYPTAYWQRMYEFFEFYTIVYFFYQLLKLNYRLLFKLFSFLYLILYCYLLSIWKLDDSLKTDSFLIIFETLFIIIFSIIWFKNCFSELTESSLLNSPSFYFITGFLIYFSGTVFLYIIIGYILENDITKFYDYYILNNYLVVVLRIIFFIGLFKAIKNENNIKALNK